MATLERQNDHAAKVYHWLKTYGFTIGHRKIKHFMFSSHLMFGRYEIPNGFYRIDQYVRKGKPSLAWILSEAVKYLKSKLPNGNRIDIQDDDSDHVTIYLKQDETTTAVRSRVSKALATRIIEDLLCTDDLTRISAINSMTFGEKSERHLSRRFTRLQVPED